MSEIKIFSDIDQLYTALAKKIITVLLKTKKNPHRKRINIALSGGNTPIGLLAHLLDGYTGLNVWRYVEIYWVDERHVPFDNPESNYGSIRPFIEGLGIPLNQIHPMGSNLNTENAAKSYNELIELIDTHRPLGSPLFDLSILGLGADGHMASLFPGVDHQHDTAFCKATQHPETGQPRISLTLSALNRSGCCIFLASGQSKAKIISTVVKGGDNPHFPASLIQPESPPLWYLDKAAASEL